MHAKINVLHTHESGMEVTESEVAKPQVNSKKKKKRQSKPRSSSEENTRPRLPPKVARPRRISASFPDTGTIKTIDEVDSREVAKPG